MDKVANMRVFSKVVEMGSFTAVANQLNSSAGNVSRAVSALEDELSTRLIQRTTRRIAVTESGNRYYRRCKQILADIDLADAEARGTVNEPRGVLRVHVIPGLGQTHVTTAIIAYRERHPAVCVELTLSQSIPDLISDQLDVSIIAATALPDSAYISQIIGRSRSILVASPTYLKNNGSPETLDDLSKHSCVRLNTPAYSPNEWNFSCDSGDVVFSPPASNFVVNDHEAMSVALRAGAGIGLLTIYSVIDDLRCGTLVRVLPDLKTRPRNVYAIYPSRQYLDAKIKTFVEFLKESVGRRLAEEEEEVGTYLDLPSRVEQLQVVR
ncbi:LysR family transcriptional regulator [Paraburkholderia caribensis]|uniref:LysR family transcriptional regulator n=1 Tax=Paraburkholderia caribensis TaxID=75105 RepID=UPI0015910CEF|nr:LysR family transcriptional regulator [Paraburkholderia caribensis]